MSLLPTDLVSFLWGILIAAIGIVLTGFLREAGRELWHAIKRRLNPPTPDDVLVDLRFEPPKGMQSNCVWTRGESVSRRLENGYKFYPHPSNGGKCVRGQGPEKSYLMVKPDGKEI